MSDINKLLHDKMKKKSQHPTYYGRSTVAREQYRTRLIKTLAELPQMQSYIETPMWRTADPTEAFQRVQLTPENTQTHFDGISSYLTPNIQEESYEQTRALGRRYGNRVQQRQQERAWSEMAGFEDDRELSSRIIHSSHLQKKGTKGRRNDFRS